MTTAHKAIQGVADLASAYYDTRAIVDRLKADNAALRQGGPPFPLTAPDHLKPGDRVLTVATGATDAEPLVSVEEILTASTTTITYADGTTDSASAVDCYLIRR